MRLSRAAREAPRRRTFVNWWWVVVGLAELALTIKVLGGLFVAATYVSRILDLVVFLVLSVVLALIVRRELSRAWAVAAPGEVSASGVGTHVPVVAVALVPAAAPGVELPAVRLPDGAWVPVEPLAARSGSRRHALFVFALGGTRGLVRLAPAAEVAPSADALALRAPRRWLHRATVATAGDERWRS